MTKDHLFLGLLIALYLWECLYWIAPGAVLFRRRFGPAWRVETLSLDFENRLGVPVVGLPVPPLGHMMACAPISVSIAPSGVATYTTSSWNPRSRAQRPVRFVPLDEIESVAANDRDLLLDGRPFARLGSPRLTRRWADLIGDLMDLDPSQRAARIDRELDLWVDTGRAKERLEAELDGRRILLFLTNLLFLHVAVVVPAAVLTFGLAKTWLPIALVWLLIQSAVALGFIALHRRLHPEARGDRWSQGLTVCVFAPLAIRAHDLLLRDLVGDSHPLAVARSLLDPEARATLVDLLCRDVAHPIPPTSPLPDEVATVVAWFDERIAALMARELAREPATAPPVADEGRILCPRCLVSLAAGTAACPDCRVPLRAA